MLLQVEQNTPQTDPNVVVQTGTKGGHESCRPVRKNGTGVKHNTDTGVQQVFVQLPVQHHLFIHARRCDPPQFFYFS